MNKMIIAALGSAVILAACVSTGKIEGHEVRGTAAPETPVEQAAREFNEHLGKILADAYGTSPEEMRRGHYSDDPGIQAAAEARLAECQNPAFNDLHACAPPQVKNLWNRYLAHADGRYAVLAMDRNMRGAGYVYCTGHMCYAVEHRISNISPPKDVTYTLGALENCRKNVRENHPVMKPDCAIYAIKDKIVWRGRMPWE